MAIYEEGFAPSANESSTGQIVNIAGAALSLALIAGVGFWGYKLIIRDVSGIPVVRAMQGEMRVLPENPGGDVARHTGLSVNEVAAEGEAGGPEDRLVLAPVTAGLAQEDLDVQPTAEADEVVPQTVETEVLTRLGSATEIPATTEPLDADAILALADEIAAGVEPLESAAEVAVIATTIPGVRQSIRPVIRPASLRVAAPVAVAEPAPESAAANTQEVAVSTEVFPAGTNLVQLGAFPSPDLAASEWTRLQSRFSQLVGARERVIQVSNQTSGTWYRLRASGFADRADARRFCAALEAEGASCIAVVVN